jgi:hypothetical protein
MGIIISLMCYEEVGVTQRQVEVQLRNRNINVESMYERTTEKQMVIDRTEGN